MEIENLKKEVEPIKHTIVKVGEICLGGGEPIRVQTMTNTPTEDVRATLAQTIRCIEAGAELVRITTPTLQDVEFLEKIHKELRHAGYSTPLVADVHFNPRVAEAAARVVEKVRINPGNYTDKKKSAITAYTTSEYALELERVQERIRPLLAVCKEFGTALRIGVNHGSLSDRIMSHFGDTPEGMVESAMEFLNICRDENFHNLVLSMKASNTRIMCYATRMLYDRMMKEGTIYPLHLGVTEAGEGEDGRIKSSAGIGTLLMEGIGDTVRVSLTEDPEKEIPVARKLVSLVQKKRMPGPLTVKASGNFIQDEMKAPENRYRFISRSSNQVGIVGGGKPAILISENEKLNTYQAGPEFIYLRNPSLLLDLDPLQQYLCDAEAWSDLFHETANVFPLVEANLFFHWRKSEQHTAFLLLEPRHLDQLFLQFLKGETKTILLLQSFEQGKVEDLKEAVIRLQEEKINLPLILLFNFTEDEPEILQVKAAALAGSLLMDGQADGLWLRNAGEIAIQQVDSTAMGILQACRLRTYRTEYIACPSCGRTQFNIVEVLQKIREKTSHLTHLKIGVMGCIVNGPGEMADADYGYVGAGPGKVNLYKGRELVKKNIIQDEAVEALITLIKEQGDWIETGHSTAWKIIKKMPHTGNR
jgi:(E)-4-hydroxy-3-methylbut-2-enyl-diphosphate synthase